MNILVLVRSQCRCWGSLWKKHKRYLDEHHVRYCIFCMHVFVIGASVLSMCFSGYGAGAAAQNGYGAKGELAILFMKLICT